MRGYYIFFTLWLLSQLIACNYKKNAVHYLTAKSSKDSIAINLLLDSALYFINEHGDEKVDFDSSLELNMQAEKLNNIGIHNQFLEGKTYFIYSILFRRKNNNDSGSCYIKKSIALLKNYKNYAQLGEAYMEQGKYYTIYDKEQLSEKIDCNEKALEQFKLTNAIEKQADVLRELGDLNQFRRNLGKALLELNESLNLYHSIGHKSLQGVYDLLCIVSSDMGDLPNGVKYGLLAVKAAEDSHDTTIQLCTIYNRLAVAYSSWSRKGDAIIYLKKALHVAQKYHDADAIETVLLNLCYMPVNEKDYKELVKLVASSDKSVEHKVIDDSVYFYACYNIAYTSGAKYEAAAYYANELKKMMHRYSWDDMMLTPIYSCLARYYLASKDYATAHQYASTYILFCEKNHYTRSLAAAYSLRSIADSGLGNFSSALKDFRRFKSLGDSIMDESKSSQIAQLQVAHETEKKDNDLKFQKQNVELLTNKSELQAVNLKKVKDTRDSVIIASILLLALAYTGYQVKQRNNKRLQIHQAEINEQNKQLKKLIEEKEWLIKEVHHRVKNNLQIVMSLMNIQSSYLQNSDALEAIKESQSRMNAMSLIHQKLYQSASLVSINMNKYINELVNYLLESFNNNNHIKAVIDVENMELDISQAVPIGLILNEAITNSIKYAFVENQKGIITILLKPDRDDEWTLTVGDNGKGLPPDFDFEKRGSIGFNLIKTLTEQIGGVVQFKNEDGFKISIKFTKAVSEKNILNSEI